jgi:hypothetical protein
MKHTALLILVLTAVTACSEPTQPVSVQATDAAAGPEAALQADCTARKGVKSSRPGVDLISVCPVAR